VRREPRLQPDADEVAQGEHGGVRDEPVGARPLRPASDEAALAEGLQLFADVRLRGSEDRGQLADVELSPLEGLQDPEPQGVGERPEPARDELERLRSQRPHPVLPHAGDHIMTLLYANIGI